ncbi:MAG TPA: exosome complex protein Rrp42 [Candidatus Aenigmarchaeota archaeon]|nr:MAG: RNA-binding protein [Candidatus Aenigmarchaeota archaeon]HDD46133.1 exosome complex protein Rrp42 [Candidatus Aenigmarchaeota archaeon]
MNIQNRYMMDLINKGTRLDNRGLDEYRKITIKSGVIAQAEGSSMVSIGDTKVLVGIKMDVGEPFPDTPNEGILIVNAELYPMASSSFELGPPDENSIELARIVDRGIREGKAIDMEKLCIEEGEKVWIIFVDIQPINHDGNLIDASAMAAISALLNTKMPKYEDGSVIYEEKKKKLPVKDIIAMTTFINIGDKVLVDPTIEEENIMDSRVSIATSQNGNICAIQKGGMHGIKPGTIEKIFDKAVERGEEIRKIIKSNV